MDVMHEANARAAEGRDISSIWKSVSPATPAPKAARERVRNALETERLGYTDASGLPALRERIARYHQDRYRVSMLPERVVVTAGSSTGFVLAFLAVLNSRDTLLQPSPGHPCYGQILKVLGVRPVPLETDDGFLWPATSIGTRLKARLACWSQARTIRPGLAITPGIDFGPIRGHRFVHLSYAGPHGAMREAAARIKAWLKG